MALSDDLLDQAERLAGRDPLRPTQADLRRAISAAYYALFHLLIADCMERLSLKSPPNLAARIARSFAHAEMKQVCRTVSNKQLSPLFQDLLPFGFSLALQSFADSFIELQTERHNADYDLSKTYDHAKVVHLITTSRTAVATWQSIRATEEANVFLAALLFGSRWSK